MLRVVGVQAMTDSFCRKGVYYLSVQSGLFDFDDSVFGDVKHVVIWFLIHKAVGNL